MPKRRHSQSKATNDSTITLDIFKIEPPSGSTFEPPQTKQESMSQGRSRSSTGRGAGSGGGARRGGHATGSKARTQPANKRWRADDAALAVEREGPLRDEDYVNRLWGERGGVGPPKRQWVDNPKSVMHNYINTLTGSAPSYAGEQVRIDGYPQAFTRVTLIGDPVANIVGIGDAPNRKDAEKLAALSACMQIGAKSLFDKHNLPISMSKAPAATSKDANGNASKKHILVDGTLLELERARTFIQYYCQRFHFGKPDLQYEKVPPKRGSRETWNASLSVGERRIGIGSANSKKTAEKEAFLDTVIYLQSVDEVLWEQFRQHEQIKGNKGDTPEVWFRLSEELDDELRDVVYDVRESELYNRAQFMLARAKTKTAPTPQPSSQPSKSKTGDNNRNWKSQSATLDRKNEDLASRLSVYQTNESPKVAALREQRTSLPITSHSSLVLSAIEMNPVTILMAATGSGKTTQVPQLILDSMIMRNKGARCNIICTQPRRIAAISVAQRVANERDEVVGDSIGYQVRFESKQPKPDGSVLFCTTGVFLRRLQNDMESADGKFLDPITHILVDEVHERDIETDLLLFCLRKVLADRKAMGKPTIKVLLMSATVDPALFERYFADPDSGRLAPVINVPGRSFPVEKHFIEQIHSDLHRLKLPLRDGGWVWKDEKVMKYLTRELSGAIEIDHVTGKVLRDSDDLEMPFAFIALIVAHVIQKSTDGHVLVFLPGWDEIKGVQNILSDPSQYPLMGLNFNDSSKFELHLLHSTIPVADQQKVFTPPPEGVRRIILSTNIAETSVTIPDVVYVVDTGKIKEKRFDPERHLSSLVSAWVGTSNLNQRAGRAGRHRAGEYYGILSEKRYAALHIHSTVEMKRTDLSNLAMHVKALNFPGMEAEAVLDATIEPPERERVAAAMAHLQTIGALDRHKDLTALGRVLLQLPVEAQIGKLCLLGSFFRCLEPALNLAAILTNRDPFLAPITAKAEADAVKASWAPFAFRSDVLASLSGFSNWYAMHRRGEFQRASRFAHDNFLSRPTLLQIAQVKEHLLSSLDRAGVLAISAGGSVTTLQPRRTRHFRSSDVEIPPELNDNAASLPLLAALIAVAVAPNFAVRKSTRMLQTENDRNCFINMSSVNSAKKTEGQDVLLQNERQIFAFGEKTLQLPRPGEKGQGQMTLRSTTRLDPLGYMLFGARKLATHSRGIECDGWLPIIGNVTALDDVERLKHILDASLLRVFEGLQAKISDKQNVRSRGYRPPTDVARDDNNEGENAAEDGLIVNEDFKLKEVEIKDLDRLTRGVVGLLNRYSDERLAADAVNSNQSAANSRAPSRPASRLDDVRGSMLAPNRSYSRPNSSLGTEPSAFAIWKRDHVDSGTRGPASIGALSRHASSSGQWR